MASYLSIDNATKTYVDEYVTTACKNLINLQRIFPACHATVIRHTMSVETLIKPTARSVTYRENGGFSSFNQTYGSKMK